MHIQIDRFCVLVLNNMHQMVIGVDDNVIPFVSHVMVRMLVAFNLLPFPPRRWLSMVSSNYLSTHIRVQELPLIRDKVLLSAATQSWKIRVLEPTTPVKDIPEFTVPSALDPQSAEYFIAKKMQYRRALRLGTKVPRRKRSSEDL